MRPPHLCLLASLPVLLAAAQPPQFSETRVSDDIRALASDAFEGRGPATPGETRTIAYIIARMRAAGLQPGGTRTRDGRRGWTQDVTLLRSGIIGTPAISLDLAGAATRLTQGEELVLRAPLNAAMQIRLEKAPLVFVGYGVTAPERQWDDFKGVDLRGKIMVVLVNDPDFETGHGDFDGKTMTYYGRWLYKYEEAARRGAAGVLVVHETAPATYGWATVSNSFSNAQFDIDRANPATRHTAAEGWMTRELAVKIFQQSGLDFEALKHGAQSRDFRPVTLRPTLSVSLDAQVDRIPSKNVLGLLPGRTRPDETVLYTAHWDHLGIGRPDARGDRIYNGAWDNASGVAGLLELARGFAAATRTARSIVFLAVTAEEKGILGSQYYVENPVYPIARTAGVFNMDGPFGFGAAHSFTVRGPKLGLTDRMIAAAARQGRTFAPDPEPEAGGFFRSDHFSFAKAGVPAASYENGRDLIDGGLARGKARDEAYINGKYHQPADEWGPDLDLSGVPQSLALLYDAGRGLADDGAWPNWDATSEFRAIRDATAGQRK